MELLLNDVDLPLLECDLRPYLRNIAAWLRKHAAPPVGVGEPVGLGEGGGRRVRTVESVEHEFRSAKYGVKGKIDVALNVSALSCCSPACCSSRTRPTCSRWS